MASLLPDPIEKRSDQPEPQGSEKVSPSSSSASPPDIAPVGHVDAEPIKSIDSRTLYAARVKVFPAAVSGFFRRMKWSLTAVLLGVYWITPWIRWTRAPGIPDQAVLVDLAHRRFYFFFIEIWPQEFYYVAGLLIMAGLGLFLATSVAGRAWCGYACPQTVWTDIYIAVERWIEGDRNARIKLDKGPWNATKIRKRVTVWALWLLIAVATGGAWVFYFADAPTLARNLLTAQADPIAYTTIGILSATTFIFAGFMREQICTYMCPWPRIQGAMIDEQSLIVTYNDWRGEPRSRHARRAQAQGLETGDCVDCNACVAVCPVGIDIRDGQQLECITCALCIDACNSVMAKVGRPHGLISYSTLVDYNAHVAQAQTESRAAATVDQKHWTPKDLLRPRTLIYASIWVSIGLAMLVTLAMRDRLQVSALHDRAPLFVTLSNGDIRNGYTLKLSNMAPEARRFSLAVEGIEGATMRIVESDHPGATILPVEVGADRVREIRVFVTQQSYSARQTNFRFVLYDPFAGTSAYANANFDAPENN